MITIIACAVARSSSLRGFTIALLIAGLGLGACGAEPPLHGAGGGTDGSVHRGPGGPLGIETAGPLRGVPGKPLSVTLVAGGGAPPYSWSLGAGSRLPSGLSFSSDGTIGGTPMQPGRFPLAIGVTDSEQRSAAASIDLVIAAPPLYDTCVAALPITLTEGRATVSGTLVAARANGIATACGQTIDLPDVFYLLSLPTYSEVSLEVLSGALVGVALIDGCGGAPRMNGCALSQTVRLEAGDWLIAVTGAEDEFSLQVNVKSITGDRCDDVVPLDLSMGSATINGIFTDAHDDYRLSCGPSNTRDRVYSFTLASPADIKVSTGNNNGNYLVKAIRNAPCGSGAEVLCNDGFGGGSLQITALKAGTYYLVLEERYTPFPGDKDLPFTVLVERSGPTPPPANDQCKAAQVIQLANDTATVNGSLLGAKGEQLPGQCNVTGPDVYYALDLAAPSQLTIAPVQANFDTSFELFSGACGQLQSVSCVSYSSYCKAGLQPGRYYIRAGASLRNGAPPPGAFSFKVTRANPPAAPVNESCQSAEAIMLDKNGKATISGRLGGAGDDVALGCNPGQVRDVVYQLALAARSDVVVQLTGNSGRWGLGVLGGKCQGGNPLYCGAGFQPARTLYSVPAGTVWIVVEGTPDNFNGDCFNGDFTLSVQATPAPPAPPNDDCMTHSEVTFPGGIGSAATVKGTTKGAANDFGATMCTSFAGGPDVVYKVVVPVNAQLRMTPTVTFGSMFFYLGDTCGGNQPLACGSRFGGNQPVTTNKVLQAGNYYLVVDSDDTVGNGVVGDFSFVLELL